MAKLTEEMVHARTRQSNLAAVSKLNCWGSELQDVSLVRRLPNVETLSLSVNKIRSLADFQHCKKLQHLFVRKNDIRDLNQVWYLRDLPALTTLWLAENPCATGPGYRLAVIKTLPNLEKLDDVPVSLEERTEAQRHGAFLPHPDSEHQPPPQKDLDRLVTAYTDEDTDEQYVTRSNHYPQSDYGRPYQRNDYSPELTSPVHSSYMRNEANSYSQEESPQSNGYDTSSYDHVEEDYRPPHPSARPTNKDAGPELESPPQEEDLEELHPRGLTRSRTESLPRLSRLEMEEPEEYSRNSHSRCRLDSMARGIRQDLDEPEPRTVLTRSRTNINVLNAVLCLIKELELQDLELVAMSVNCRIDELRV